MEQSALIEPKDRHLETVNPLVGEADPQNGLSRIYQCGKLVSVIWQIACRCRVLQLPNIKEYFLLLRTHLPVSPTRNAEGTQ